MSVLAQPAGFGRLLASELLRIRSRRLFRGLAAAVLVVVGISFLVAASQLDRSPQNVFDAIFLRGYVFAFFPPMLALGLLVGSSHVGAEWGSRGVTNLLFWEPRRLRVLAAKFSAVAIVMTVGSFAVLCLVGVGIRSLASTIQADLSWVVLLTLRMAVLIGIASLLCAATAAVTRSTTAAAAGAFVLLVIVEPIMYGWIDDFEKLAITANAFRFVTWGTVETGQGPVVALAILLAYAAVFTGIAMSVFRKQEMG
jgi:ABC-type transport system involved in multi-copper enzyme maturation permease subunit